MLFHKRCSIHKILVLYVIAIISIPAASVYAVYCSSTFWDGTITEILLIAIDTSGFPAAYATAYGLIARDSTISQLHCPADLAIEHLCCLLRLTEYILLDRHNGDGVLALPVRDGIEHAITYLQTRRQCGIIPPCFRAEQESAWRKLKRRVSILGQRLPRTEKGRWHHEKSIL